MTPTKFIPPSLLLLLATGCPDDGGGDGSTGATTQPATGSQTTNNGTDTGEETGMPTTMTPDTGTDDDPDTGTGDSGTLGTGDSSGSGESSSTGEMLPEIDCAMAPTTVVSVTPIPNARGYHGLVITPDGMIIGSDGTSLIQSTYDGDASVFIPGIGYGEQMDWLPDGDFVYNTDDGALSRVGLDATINVIQPNVFAYGATTGPDGMVYVVADGVSRINPMNGETEDLFGPTGDQFPHSLGFSPDGSRAYVGTIGEGGTVLYADFDEDMNPLSANLQVFTTGVGGGGFGSHWHDAVPVDACGNFYIPDFDSSNIYRVTPGGDVSEFWVPQEQSQYAHGAAWGTGEHGWRLDAIYVPQPYNDNTVAEVVVGVPSRDYAGPVVNAEPMSP